MSSHDGSDYVHFFKKIEEDTLRNGELRIPRSFVNKYWEEISNPVLLLLPNDGKWEVNWRKLDADIWLIDKWKKFAEFYGLDQDHLLVFKYVGKSRFQVVILDQNGLEIGYPLMEGTLHYEENGNSLSQRKRAKSPLPFSHSTKKVKTNPRKGPNCYPSQDGETKGGKEKMYGNRSCSKSKAIQSPLGALERAQAFKSENHFFIRQMQSSYIKKPFLLTMPGKFIREDQRNEDGVTLWMSEDITWHVKFCMNRCTGQNVLSTGWKTFVKDNNLKKGDVCVFEQIKKPGISYRVLIYRDNEESSPSMFPGSEFRRYNNNNNNNLNEVSGNHFTLSIKQNQFYKKTVPMKFFKNHGVDDSKTVILRVGNKSWPVRLEYYLKHNYCRFASGWFSFTSECNLKPGDVCNFVLIDKDKFVFEVIVSSCID